jgi:7-carboxy-7-deazaguanine synthase
MWNALSLGRQKVAVATEDGSTRLPNQMRLCRQISDYGYHSERQGAQLKRQGVGRAASSLAVVSCWDHLLCAASDKTFLLIMPDGEKTLTINEIYHSIQGESTWVGGPCVFVRLTFCNLRCNYCDTEYAFYEGKKQTLKEIVDAVAAYRCPLVEITGGEPLLQKNVLPLMSVLCDSGYTVLLETSGAHDISKVDPRVHRIMDLKTPGSGEVDKNLWSNIDHLTLRDEVKFVMGSREDYEWSRDKVQRYELVSRCHAVLFSPIFGHIDPREIVEWILADKLNVRFQLQMHKFIWSPTQRGV